MTTQFQWPRRNQLLPTTVHAALHRLILHICCVPRRASDQTVSAPSTPRTLSSRCLSTAIVQWGSVFQVGRVWSMPLQSRAFMCMILQVVAPVLHTQLRR